MTSIDTAVPLFEKNDLEQPLLIIHLGGGGGGGDGDGDDDDKEDGQKTRTSSSTAASCCWGQRFLTSWNFLNGFSLGFIIQTVMFQVRLVSSAIIAIHSGVGLESPESWISWTRELHSTPIFYVWLLFITVIFIAIVTASADDYDGGFRFHVGLVFGCFTVLGVIDLYFGAPLAVFATLFASLLTCLSLCYGMKVTHDRFIINE